MAKIEDRVRHLHGAGGPVATGIVAIGDAAACTNPSVGRGASIGLLQATCLRDVLRTADPNDPVGLIRSWYDTTGSVVTPFVRDTVDFDRHRLAEIDAQIAGVPYETDDPGWNLGQKLRAGAASDPELLRAAMSVMSVLVRGVDVFRQDGILDKVLGLEMPPGFPGPNRAELLDIIGVNAPKEDACVST